MDVLNDLASRLPETPRKGMLEAALAANVDSDLGGELLIYARESYYPEGDDIPEIWGGLPAPKHGRWGAKCTCTACMEDFWAGWLKGGGITMVVGDDGSTWACVPDKDNENVVGWTENDSTYCPLCGCELHLTPRKKLRGGRTYQVMAGSIERVGDITVAMAWIIARHIDEFGLWDTECRPFGAMALLPGGRMRRYMHETPTAYGGTTRLPDWRLVNSRDDPYQIKYYSIEACNYKKFGIWMWPELPDLDGATAEKTGLAEYIRGGGRWPVEYLRIWKFRPAVENLMKCGMARAIIDRIEDCVEASANYGYRRGKIEVDDLADWRYQKPKEMMHFTKQEIRECRKWRWKADEAALWMEGVAYGLWETGAAAAFERLLRKLGDACVSRYVGKVTDGWNFEPLEMWERYLDKQETKRQIPIRTGFGMLIDYREALDNLVQAPTQEELWPRDLRAAHDRIFAAKAEAEDPESVANFMTVAAKWQALEWSDGEVCIRLPRCNGDLVREGHVLHHCVGGYGAAHLRGKLILFVRHARRPERSWYTLNIDTTRDKPRRIQLHGWHNEVPGDKILCIPQRVLDFVERWEREVLGPVFRRVKADEKSKTPRRKVGAA